MNTPSTQRPAMSFEEAEALWVAHLGLEKDYLRWIENQLPHPKYQDLIVNSFNFESDVSGEQWMIDSYNKIKDTSWPECKTYQDLLKLPVDIVNECRYQHGFDFLLINEKEIDRERWQQYKSGRWPVWELIRYKNVVLDLQSYIKDKTVLDFAAHGGTISLMALNAGASFVKITEVRPKYTQLIKKIIDLAGYSERTKVFEADIHNYDDNTKMAQGIDTVLLYGIMYHVHDHCQILDSIIQAKPKNIIIDTLVCNSIIDNPSALMTWNFESSANPWGAWYDNRSLVATGQPNPKWFEMYFLKSNYNLISKQNYPSVSDQAKTPLPNSKRSIMVFESN